MALTLEPGTLIVASAYPDPPFEVVTDGLPGGFDLELMGAVCRELELTMRPVRYAGSDFNGIFDGLGDGTYDAVISGTRVS
jgi:polar amino acid transport system substrate-binding protein